MVDDLSEEILAKAKEQVIVAAIEYVAGMTGKPKLDKAVANFFNAQMYAAAKEMFVALSRWQAAEAAEDTGPDIQSARKTMEHARTLRDAVLVKVKMKQGDQKS